MNHSTFDIGIVGLNHGVNTLMSAIVDLPKITKIHLVGSQRSFGKKFEIESRKSEVISFSEMLLEPKLKVIFIASPPSTHLDLVSQALAREIAVYCEKPGGATTSELERMIQLSNSKKTPLAIGYQYRHDPYIQLIKKRMKNVTINEIQEIHIGWKTSSALSNSRQIWKANMELGGEVSRDFLIHVIDYLDFFLPTLFDTDNLKISKFINAIIEYDNLHLNLKINNILLDIQISRFSSDGPSHDIKILGNRFSLIANRYFPFGLNDCNLVIDDEKVFLKDMPEMEKEVDVIISNERFGKNLQIYAASALIQEFLQSIFSENTDWEYNLQKTLRITKLLDQIQMIKISD